MYRAFIFVQLLATDSGKACKNVIHHVAVHFSTCVMMVEKKFLFYSVAYIVTFTVMPVKLCCICGRCRICRDPF